MKILLDMNMSKRWCAFLAAAGWECVHWSDVGRAHDRDEVIMAYAAAHAYVVLTQDLDFGQMLASTGSNRPSVVQLRGEENFPEKIGAQVQLALESFVEGLESGALVTIDPEKLRCRVLPFRHKG